MMKDVCPSLLFPQMESSPNLYLSKLTTCFCSHRESLIRPALRGWLPVKGRQVEAETIYSRRSRYDDSDHNAHATSRSRSARVQHVSRRSWSNILCWYRWSERADQRAQRSDRAPPEESRALHEGGHQTAERSFAIRTTWYWEDTIGTSSCKQSGN